MTNKPSPGDACDTCGHPLSDDSPWCPKCTATPAEAPTLHMTTIAPDAAQQYITASLDNLAIVFCPFHHATLQELISYADDCAGGFERNATHYLLTGHDEDGKPWRINMAVAK